MFGLGYVDPALIRDVLRRTIPGQPVVGVASQKSVRHFPCSFERQSARDKR